MTYDIKLVFATPSRKTSPKPEKAQQNTHSIHIKL